MAGQKPCRPQFMLLRIAVLLGLVAGQRYQPGLGLHGVIVGSLPGRGRCIQCLQARHRPSLARRSAAPSDDARQVFVPRQRTMGGRSASRHRPFHDQFHGIDRLVTYNGSALSSPRPDTERDSRSDHAVHEGRRQTGRQSAHAGSRLKLIDASGRSRRYASSFQPYWGKPAVRNDRILPIIPYGMIGRIEETSASFEARSAPRSHPTKADLGPLFCCDARHSRLLRAQRTVW